MSIRIRKVDGTIIAVCAVETDAEPGDIYLDDALHEALADKFAIDWDMPWAANLARRPFMESVKMRDAQTEVAKWAKSLQT